MTAETKTYANCMLDTYTLPPTDPAELAAAYAKFDYASLQAVCDLYYGDVELAEAVLWEVDGALIDPEQRKRIDACIYAYVDDHEEQNIANLVADIAAEARAS